MCEVGTAVEDRSVVVLESPEITLPDSGLSYTERKKTAMLHLLFSLI